MELIDVQKLDRLGFIKIQPAKVSIENFKDKYTKIKQANMPVILDDMMLANCLGIKKKTLYWASNPNIQNNRFNPTLSLYRTYKIPKGICKKTGKQKYRQIQDPESRLKYIQKKIKQNILDKVELPEYITGFRKGVGIRDTSIVHSGIKIVVSLDIDNFFNSIHQWHLQKLFKEYFLYPEKVSKILSELCTYKYFVPQGAPTSPSLANIVGYFYFDKKIDEIAKKYDCQWTRYADDITFSTDKEYPKTEVMNPKGHNIITSEIDNLIEEVNSVLNQNKFKLNRYKTKVMRKPSRQWVLGSVVNIEPNILKKDYRTLKSILHNLKYNSLEHEASKTDRTEYMFLSWLRGKISHLTQINRPKGEALKDELNLILKSKGHEEHVKEIKII